MGDSDFQIRDMRSSDFSFVIQSWMRHVRRTHSWLPSEAFFRLYERALISHLNRGPALVACNPSYHDHVFGYAVGGPWRASEGLLHFALIKPMYRKYGLARALLGRLRRDLDVATLYPTSWTADLSAIAHMLGELRPDLFGPRGPREKKNVKESQADHDENPGPAG